MHHPPPPIPIAIPIAIPIRFHKYWPWSPWSPPAIATSQPPQQVTDSHSFPHPISISKLRLKYYYHKKSKQDIVTYPISIGKSAREKTKRIKIIKQAGQR